MASLNKVILIGNTGRDAELRYLASGVAQASFTIAVNRNTRGADGEWTQETDWFNVVVWRELAERISQQVTKGKQVYVEGHLKLDQWEDKNGGGKRSMLRVVVESFQYLEPRQDGGGGGGGNMSEAPMRAPRQVAASPARAPAPAARSYAPSNNYDDDMGAPPGKSGGGTEDDIPF